MKTLLLVLILLPTAQADTLILPEIPGTGAIDITKPGLRIEDGVIYETHPGPLGIINQMGTTYKLEGDQYVPHQGILGPQDFTKPSYRVEREDLPPLIDNPFED